MNRETKSRQYGKSETARYQTDLLEELGRRDTNIDRMSGLEYNVDGCSCMSCGCFKSAWTVVLSPAGIAAGLAAFAAATVLE